MEYENILYEVKGQTAVIILNRPKAWNALCKELNDELEAAIRRADADPQIRVLILTGGPKVFAAGADVKQMADASPMDAARTADQGQGINELIERIGLPVIAAVNGMALGGGCELAMACDIRLASEKAKFGQPETGLGITPGFGGTQRLPRIVGAARAMELILTAKNISADRAREIGLVSEVYPPEELMDRALELANAIAANAQVAVRQSKAAIRRGLQTDMATGAAFESEAFGLCFSTQDQKDAMNAFLNKEKFTAFQNR